MKLDKNAKQLLILLTAGVLLFGLIKISSNKNNSKYTFIPPTNEKKELPPKAERYFISGKSLPQFTEVLFDPYNIKIGQKQTVTIRVKNTEPINSVYVILNTDNKTQRFDFKLSDGSPIDGNWQGSWTFNDTKNKIYSFAFYSASDNKSSNIDFSFGKEFPKSYNK